MSTSTGSALRNLLDGFAGRPPRRPRGDGGGGRARAVRLPALALGVVALLSASCGGKETTTQPPQSPVIRVLSPNGGETLVIGVPVAITWTASDGDTPAGNLQVTLAYSANNGTSWISIASSEANDGTYTWTVPALATMQGIVRAMVSDGANLGTDVSDAPFTISATPPPPRNTLYLGDESAAPGSDLDVPFLLNNQDTAGLVEARIHYDAQVASFQSARLTGRGVGLQLVSLALAADTVKVTVRQQAGLTIAAGDGAIAFLTFRLVGASGSSTELVPVTARMLSPSESALGVRTLSGSISVLTVDTAATLTAEGWTAFEQGDFELARQKFDSAVGLDAQYGPAYTGQGWVRLVRAVAAADFRSAVSSFDTAFARGETGPDVRGGRAAADLALGGSDLAGAVQEAQAAVAASPNFVFDHRTTFDYRDLYLTAAFAYAGQGNFAGARQSADQVQASGIAQANPQTWQVDGVTYPTFQAAVIAWLYKMSETFAG